MITVARWLLRRLLPSDVRDAVAAELDAEYEMKIRTRAGRASLWYWRQVLASLPWAVAMRQRRAGRLAADAVQDARVALRYLRRDRRFTIAAVVTLALGIGATTAMFSVVDAVMLRPLPYAAPEQLLRIWSANPRGIPRNQISPADFFDWREQARGLSSLAGFFIFDVTITAGGEPQRLPAASATANLANTLGVAPILGRWFVDAETAGRGQPVAARMAMVGVAAGAVIAWLAAPALGGWLYGIAPRNPWTLFGAAIVLMVTALLAAYLPARRLLRFDVVHALRTEH